MFGQDLPKNIGGGTFKMNILASPPLLVGVTVMIPTVLPRVTNANLRMLFNHLKGPGVETFLHHACRAAGCFTVASQFTRRRKAASNRRLGNPDQLGLRLL